MVKLIHYLDEAKSKRAILDTNSDERITEIRELEGTGRAHDSTRGDILYLHETKHSGAIYYFFHWTRWQGEEVFIRVLELYEAKQFTEDAFKYMTKEEIARCTELGLLSLEETA